MSSSSGSGSNDPNRQQSSSNWDPLLQHSSAIGILKPGIVFNVFNTNPGATTGSSSASMTNQLPPPRLVRTGHKDDGSSVFVSDSVLNPFTPFGPAASAFTVLDSQPAVPVPSAQIAPGVAPPAFANTLPRCPPAGVLFTITDIPGNGYSAPMHRTQSLDYAVVLRGEIVLGLDGGDERTVRAGDFIVQTGTNHTWTNRAREPCRVLFVMVSSEKVVLPDGTALEETVFQTGAGAGSS